MKYQFPGLMKQIPFFLAITTIVSLLGCSDYEVDPGFAATNPSGSPSIGDYFQLEFNGRILTDQSQWYLASNNQSYIKGFNKLNYPYAYTIMFAPVLRSISFHIYCYAELYNITDSVPISKTLVQSNSRGWMEIRSSDILDNLPERIIILAIRLRSENDGMLVATASTSYLYIFGSK